MYKIISCGYRKLPQECLERSQGLSLCLPTLLSLPTVLSSVDPVDWCDLVMALWLGLEREKQDYSSYILTPSKEMLFYKYGEHVSAVILCINIFGALSQ